MKNFFTGKLTTNITENNARENGANQVEKLLRQQEGFGLRPLVILCIGSDRYTGDSLGPLIGTYLQEKTTATVFGSLDCPVHAGNLVETIKIINSRYYHPIIIAVDACLGRKNEVGNIEIWQGALQAGVAVGNCLPWVGHLAIIGVVNSGGQHGYLDLQCTPLSTVVKLSKVISGMLEDVCFSIAKECQTVKLVNE